LAFLSILPVASLFPYIIAVLIILPGTWILVHGFFKALLYFPEKVKGPRHSSAKNVPVPVVKMRGRPAGSRRPFCQRCVPDCRLPPGLPGIKSLPRSRFPDRKCREQILKIPVRYGNTMLRRSLCLTCSMIKSRAESLLVIWQIFVSFSYSDQW